MPFSPEFDVNGYALPQDEFVLTAETALARSSRTTNDVTSVDFDSNYELLWTANAAGRLSAYTTDNFNQSSSFNGLRSAVQHVSVNSDLIMCATSDSVNGFSRGGEAYFQTIHPSFRDLRCLYRYPDFQSTVFVGGMQDDFVIFDMEKQIPVHVYNDGWTATTKIRSNQKSIVCANDNGTIIIRSPDGQKVAHMQAFLGPITGFDVNGNYVIAAGCARKSTFCNDYYGTPKGESVIKVYDVRYLTPLTPLPTPFPAQHVFFMDSYSNNGSILMTSHFGHAWVMNMHDSMNRVHSLPTLPRYLQIKHAALSSSGQVFALVDNQQNGYIYTMYNKNYNSYGVVNYHSRSLSPQFGDMYGEEIQPTHPGNDFQGLWTNNHNSQDALGVDYYGQGSSSKVGFATFGMQALNLNNSNDFRSAPSYPPRSGKSSRLMSDVRYVLKSANKGPIPIYVPEFFTEYESRSQWLALPGWDRSNAEQNIPKFYQKAAEKDRHDKFIYERYNNSTQVPLLKSIEAPIVNCVLRALSAVSIVKKTILEHLCRLPNCMLCEIQFIFRNIHGQENDGLKVPITCTAVVREMAAYRDFAAIKQLRPVAFSGLPISLFCNFFFQHIFSDSKIDYNGSVSDDKLIQNLFYVKQVAKHLCGFCGGTENNEKLRHIIELDYSRYNGNENIPFVQLLEDSFGFKPADGNMMATCFYCRRISNRRDGGGEVYLPPVLAIDTDINKAGYQFWVHIADTFNHRPVNSMNDFDSRFSRDVMSEVRHIPNPHERTVRGVSEAMHTGDRWRHYLPSMISATPDDKGHVQFSVNISKEANRRVYALCSVVMSVNDAFESERFVAICKNANPSNPVLNWTVFNDYIVTAVKQDEALYTNSNWKLPHLLFYCDIETLEQQFNPVAIPKDVFDHSSTQESKDTATRDHPRASPPPAGEVVALDSEFIQNDMREHVLGRVSCLNKDGQVIIDDYAMLGCGEKISDYLTQYSGIAEGDLDPKSSSKCLLSRKSTYIKVLYLVENNNIFIGHALHNDFKILNIYVPKSQIIDTCELYRLEERQVLSLRDLVRIVFGDVIQTDKHDSVEDAMYALRLYNHYNEKKKTALDMRIWLQTIYEMQRYTSTRGLKAQSAGGAPKSTNNSNVQGLNRVSYLSC